MNRTQGRVAAIEALPEEDRKRLWELMHRGDVLHGCVQELGDAPPSPDRPSKPPDLPSPRALRSRF